MNFVVLKFYILIKRRRLNSLFDFSLNRMSKVGFCFHLICHNSNEMHLFCIASKVKSSMLSKLTCVTSLSASFLLPYGKCFKEFLWFAVALVSLNAFLTGKPDPITNSAIESSPVITVNVIRPVSSTLVNALNHFTFFASLSQNSTSLNEFVSNFKFFDQYVCGFCGTADFNYWRYSSNYLITRIFINLILLEKLMYFFKKEHKNLVT